MRKAHSQPPGHPSLPPRQPPSPSAQSMIAIPYTRETDTRGARVALRAASIVTAIVTRRVTCLEIASRGMRAFHRRICRTWSRRFRLMMSREGIIIIVGVVGVVRMRTIIDRVCLGVMASRMDMTSIMEAIDSPGVDLGVLGYFVNWWMWVWMLL